MPLSNLTKTENLDSFLSPTASERVEAAYQVLFFLVGTPINVASLHQQMTNWRRLARHHGGANANELRLVKLAVNLILANLWTLVLVCPFKAYWLLSVVWRLGDTLCRLFALVYPFSFHLWSNIVAAIAVDMLLCIRSPLSSYRNAGARVNWLIAASWLSALACSLPMSLLKGLVPIPSKLLPLANNASGVYYQCHVTASGWPLQAYNYVHLGTTFYIPLLVIVVSYVWIGLSLGAQNRSRRRLTSGIGSRKSGRRLCSSANGGERTRTRQVKRRFLLATALIVGAYVLSWLPYQLLALAELLLLDRRWRWLRRLHWLEASMVCSALVNPFLYRFRGVTSRSLSEPQPLRRVPPNLLHRFRFNGDACPNRTEQSGPL